ncbi:MAG: DUF3516 domain-containing protein [Fibromonadales bacterium]|nr:DUF3516 domain-containing protein [Fibromonadales bacterium]
MTDVLTQFLNETQSKGLSLYPAQEEAIMELLDGKNVILATPTGSGKSLVASFLHRLILSKGVSHTPLRSVYTCPIKALVNEKWIALCKEFGAQNVGLSTGDATVNHNAPILCCTAEILEQIALKDGENSNIGAVAMDEFHYYSDKERGVAWQIPLLTMKKTQFLLISATLGDTKFFESEMTKLNGLPSVCIRNSERPVPLEFSYSENPLPNEVQRLLNEGKGPVYVVHFTQSEAAENAQAFTSLDLAGLLKKDKIAEATAGFRFSSPFGADIKRWLRQGVGLHHAGLLPKYRILTEKMAQQGLLPVICGTDTLGVGVNVPIRTVLFTKLTKFGGEKSAILSVRDFHQIAGRAGRKGFDSVGYVIAQAPEHVIENKMREAKFSKTGRKFQKACAPEGFISWDKTTFEKLIRGEPEKLLSRFAVDANIILQTSVHGCRELHNLIMNSHDTKEQKKIHIKRALQIYRSLIAQGIIANGKPAIDLNDRFAMHQPLSLWLLESTEKITDLNALTLLTLIEAILEEAEMVRRKQLSKLKSEAISEMKSQGIDFEERQARLEEMRPPEPENADWIEASFSEFSKRHPWVSGERVHPQTIVLEMFAECFSFSGYIKQYGLERIEGLLLRHINSVYKVLAHTVPEKHKSEEILEMQDYLREMLQRVDSSLLDEWQRMQNPEFVVPEEREEPLPPFAVSERMVKALVLQFIVAWGKGDFAAAADCLEHSDAQAETQCIASLRAMHKEIRLDAEGRSNKHTYIEKRDDVWIVQRMLFDYDEQEAGQFEFVVDLGQSKREERLVISIVNAD